MKKLTYTLAIITLLISSLFLTSCTAEEINDDSQNQITVNSNAVDPPVAADRPK